MRMGLSLTAEWWGGAVYAEYKYNQNTTETWQEYTDQLPWPWTGIADLLWPFSGPLKHSQNFREPTLKLTFRLSFWGHSCSSAFRHDWHRRVQQSSPVLEECHLLPWVDCYYKAAPQNTQPSTFCSSLQEMKADCSPLWANNTLNTYPRPVTSKIAICGERSLNPARDQ